jgi:plastocyanin
MRTLLAAAALAAFVPAAAVQAAPSPPTVHIRDDAFTPATLTVHAGDTVTFVNDDDDAHTVTADDGSWDSDGLNQSESFKHRFAKTGKITYHCTVHPFMHGTIIVKSAQ